MENDNYKIVAEQDNCAVMENISRHAGYNMNTSAGENVDNSMRDDINAKNISVTFDANEDGIVEAIYYADDGKSMPDGGENVFWPLGKAKKNNSPTSLSKFAMGGKTGSFFQGNIVQLFCKVDGSVVKSESSIYEYPVIKYYEEKDIPQEEIDLFNSKINNSNSGTMVVCKELDWKPGRELHKDAIVEDMTRYFSMVYSDLLRENKKNLTVDGNKVPLISYDGGHIKGTTKPLGKMVLKSNILTEMTAISLSGSNTKVYYTASHKTRDPKNEYVYDVKGWGIDLFRNGKLISKYDDHIKDEKLFGKKDSCFKQSSLYVRIYFDGSHDGHFGTQYNKKIDNADDFSQELLDKLMPLLAKDLKLSHERYDQDGRARTKSGSEKDMTKLSSMLNEAFQSAKDTKAYKDRHVNPTPTPPGPKPPKPTPPGPKPPKPKDRKNYQFVNVSSADKGKDERLVRITPIGDCKYNVVVNREHPAYKHFKCNSEKLAVYIYYKVSELMSIDNKYVETGDKKYMHMAYQQLEIDDITEQYVHDRLKKYSDESYDGYEIEEEEFLREHPNCQGVYVTSDELEHEFSTAAASS